MEAWKEELLRRHYLAHHGIKGQEWGKRNGPPYPLDLDDHSANERKHNWPESIKNFIKKYGTKEDWETYLKKLNGEDKEEKKKKGSSRSGSGRGGAGKKAEKKEEEKKEDEFEKWEGPLYKYLDRMLAKNGWTYKDLMKEVINAHGKDDKGKDYDEFLVALSDSGALKSDEWKKVKENQKELNRMRQKAVDYYEKRQSEEEDVSNLRKRESSEDEKKEKTESKKEADEKEKKRREALEDEENEEKKKKKSVTHSELADLFIEDYLEHAGVSVLDGAKVGSGRRPLGSGDRPYQDYPEMRKKSTKKEAIKKFIDKSPTVQAHKMTNDELRFSIERLKLQQEFINRSSQNISDGRNFVEGMVIRYGTKTVQKFVDDLANKTGAYGAKKFFDTMVENGAPKKKKDKGMSEKDRRKEEKAAEKAAEKERRKEEKAAEKERKKEERLFNKKGKWTEKENEKANEMLKDFIDKKKKEGASVKAADFVPTKEEAEKMVDKILGDWASEYTKTEKDKMRSDIIDEAKRYAR